MGTPKVGFPNWGTLSNFVGMEQKIHFECGKRDNTAGSISCELHTKGHSLIGKDDRVSNIVYDQWHDYILL